MTGRVLSLGLCAALVACAPEPRRSEPLVLETVEVGEAVDAELTTETDAKQKPSLGDDLILPGDFPPGLPVPQAARLVGSGEAAPDRTFLVLHASAAPEAVTAWYGERLPAAGWRVSGAGSVLTAERGGRQVVLTFEPLSPGTSVRVEY